jgi:hypothetical protein
VVLANKQDLAEDPNSDLEVENLEASVEKKLVEDLKLAEKSLHQKRKYQLNQNLHQKQQYNIKGWINFQPF